MPLGAFKAALMGTAGVSTADVVLLQTQTASDAASVTFTSGIDSTYGEYIFGFYNIHTETDLADLHFQVNVAGQSGYNETITSTVFHARQNEAGDATALGYITGLDQAQGTAYQQLAENIGNGNDESAAGILHIFSPSSTTYVKHFYSRFQVYNGTDLAADQFNAGYINVTAAIDEISFKVESGNMNGVIQMYGIA